MNKVLVVHYSQTGQLDSITKQFTQPLVSAPDIEVTFENLCPEQPFPFPWPFLTFLDTFPECVYRDPPALKEPIVSADDDFDLVVLAYQVWFLSPSMPMTAFLQHPRAASLLKDKPVVTLIGCRNMWLMAQEDMKQMLDGLGARLAGNVALVDEAGSFLSFFATPLWMLTGRQGPFLGGRIPRAGVSQRDITGCDRFGIRIRERLQAGNALDETLLRGLHAVTVDDRLISSERTGKRAFRLWGRLLRAVGPAGSWQRRPVLAFYSVFLIAMILTVVPLGVLVRKITAPLTRKRIAHLRARFAAPSGE
ncbi:dialkylrecorsinol condensing enzyme [Marinobacter changyiensis]|uniref:dialkylrecorsinol condensing enzyme n=1 Tax=Marinobacter changyiensis TaxID=2604091 RepID=UPI001264AC85|nr:dialkylrecorsinol condensing enzyme [Marinobacter changyiensis]